MQRRIEIVLSWAKAFWRALWPRGSKAHRVPTQRHAPRPVGFAHWQGTGSAPAGHWAACHPSTEHIFKAEVTCPRGHRLTLKGHSISAEGQVQPSVVCRHSGCDFHEFVVLDNWAQRRAAVPAIRTN
ncbi:hypothetical protein [Rhizobium leucaenae]|uniref:hypothetical protein n=1 Tax=Rhizobium leucaenae TaxID=29450 RepID=UPI00160705AD|nr:hypothetical protein [Rhizobium leucaenae]MBB6305593.1 hypothetical protein [Rhizobium leucaenae]